MILIDSFNPLSAKFIKWSNTLKQFVGKLPTNCLSVFDHFMGLALKGLIRVDDQPLKLILYLLQICYSHIYFYVYNFQFLLLTLVRIKCEKVKSKKKKRRALVIYHTK